MKKFIYEDIEQFVSKPLFDEEVILNNDPSYPRITIVTPSYNQAEFFEKTILSILNQNYPNLEYIVIDGGSVDETVELIKKYEKYITYWSVEPESGQAEAVNIGFEKATGDIVGCQNSDDIYLPGAFEMLAKEYKKNSDNDVYFGHTMLIDDSDNIMSIYKSPSFNFFAHLYEGSQVLSQSVFFNKEVFFKVGLLRTDYVFSFDYEYLCRLAHNNAKFKKIDNILGCLRIHEKAKTFKIPEVGKKEHNSIRDHYIEISKYYCPKALGYFLSRVRKFIIYLLKLDYVYLFQTLRLKTIRKVNNGNKQEKTPNKRVVQRS